MTGRPQHSHPVPSESCIQLFFSTLECLWGPLVSNLILGGLPWSPVCSLLPGLPRFFILDSDSCSDSLLKWSPKDVPSWNAQLGSTGCRDPETTVQHQPRGHWRALAASILLPFVWEYSFLHSHLATFIRSSNQQPCGIWCFALFFHGLILLVFAFCCSISMVLLCCCVLRHFSCVWFLATLWTVACHSPLSMGFSRQESWSGLPCPPLGDLSDPGIKPTSSALQTCSLPTEPLGKPNFMGFLLDSALYHSRCSSQNSE